MIFPEVKIVHAPWMKDVAIPSEMGTPRADQLVGTPFEKLSELSGRICYDSVGNKRSRSSADYHQHIFEVNHHSVYRHLTAHFRLSVPYEEAPPVLLALMSRPGVYLTRSGIGSETNNVGGVLTINGQAALDWSKHLTSARSEPFNARMLHELRVFFRTAAPAIADYLEKDRLLGNFQIENFENQNLKIKSLASYEIPVEDMYVSFYVKCSRGCSEEMLRHTWQVAPSKRSTRYVDESQSGHITHPLAPYTTYQAIDESFASTCKTYKTVYDETRKELLSQGYDKSTARKQARGAARNCMPLGLITEKIYTCSLREFSEIMRQRLPAFADAEIRVVAEKMQQAVLNSVAQPSVLQDENWGLTGKIVIDHVQKAVSNARGI